MKNGLQRLIGLVYLSWSLVMAWYWLVLFEDLPVPALVPFGGAALATVLFAVGFLRSEMRWTQASLLLSLAITVVFSILAWQLQPPCNCYRFSFVDLTPPAISVLMAVIVWLQLRN